MQILSDSFFFLYHNIFDKTHWSLWFESDEMWKFKELEYFWKKTVFNWTFFRNARYISINIGICPISETSQIHTTDRARFSKYCWLIYWLLLISYWFALTKICTIVMVKVVKGKDYLTCVSSFHKMWLPVSLANLIEENFPACTPIK